jgi:hypothetical protein
MIMVASDKSYPLQTDSLFVSPNLVGITLIEVQAQYKYIDMGQDTFMTLVIPQNNNNSRPKSSRPRGVSPMTQGSNLVC